MDKTLRIINVRDINNAGSANSPWISSPDEVERSAREALQIAEPSFGLETVDTLTDLNELLSDPPEECILLNAHGESFPKPANWTSWEEFFNRLGDNIHDRGWIIISVTGIPLYYYGTNEKAVHEVNPSTGHSGPNILFSKASAQITNIVGTVAMQTAEGLRACRMVNLPLSAQQSVARCLIVEPILPEPAFYSVGPIYGAASFPIGKGYLIYNGMMCTDFGLRPNRQTDRLLGKLAIGFLLATLRRPDTPAYTQWQIDALTTTLQEHVKSMVTPRKPVGRNGEKIVQKSVEDILRVKDFHYAKNVQIPFSAANRYVDFACDEYDLAVEVKLCNSSRDKSKIAEEMNADITAYRTRYQNIIFVVYDCGFISDPSRFKADFERYPGVRVLVV